MHTENIHERELTCVRRRVKDAYIASRYFEIEYVYVADVYIFMHINVGPREMFSIPRENPSPAFNLWLAICSSVAPRGTAQIRDAFTLDV